jgi:hypothetical protein
MPGTEKTPLNRIPSLKIEHLREAQESGILLFHRIVCQEVRRRSFQVKGKIACLLQAKTRACFSSAAKCAGSSDMYAHHEIARKAEANLYLLQKSYSALECLFADMRFAKSEVRSSSHPQ